jgi:hypothetical protein
MRQSDQCSFSPEHYLWILNRAVELGYEIHPVMDHTPGKINGTKSILLRHDIDISPAEARLCAAMESEIGISSTDFIRVRSRMYDLSKGNSADDIRWIADHGFEIGLHYEPQAYRSEDLDPIPTMNEEREQLSELLGVAIVGAAGHLATNNGVYDSQTVKKAGFTYEAFEPSLDSSDPRWKYISDSSKRWREGCLCNWLGIEDRLSVLMHPYWWFGEYQDHQVIVNQLENGD